MTPLDNILINFISLYFNQKNFVHHYMRNKFTNTQNKKLYVSNTLYELMEHIILVL
jgi:hypothetical protein